VAIHDKLRSIQVLRGVAVTGVLVHHAYRFVDAQSFARIGAAGVDLFFVISGFIMATIGSGRKPSQFLVDRIWRIYPLWFMAVVPWVIVSPRDHDTILTTVTLWPIWDDSFHRPALILGWTLGFEILFYAAFALGLATRAVVPLALFAIVFAIGPRNPLLAYLGSPVILEFLGGVAVAQLPTVRRGGMLIFAALAWLAFAPLNYYEYFCGYDALLRFFAWGVPAALLVYGVRSLEPVLAHRHFDLAVLVGNSSFSIYLFHRLIVRGQMPWPIEIVTGIGLGVAVYLLVERRIMRLRPVLPRRGNGGTHIYDTNVIRIDAPPSTR
jgi:exopolysaccharide production protein ExoZ